MKVTIPPPAIRNRHACADIMRKGGAHGPSRKAQRNTHKRQLQRAVREGSNSSPFCCLWHNILSGTLA